MQKLILLLAFFPVLMVNAQCTETLPVNGGVQEWRKVYADFFPASDTTLCIQSDSVLLTFLLNPLNSSGKGKTCSYVKACEAAYAEIDQFLPQVYKAFSGEDSLLLFMSQASWKQYMDNLDQFEQKRLSSQGIQLNGEDIVSRYYSEQYFRIKQRLLALRRYITS